MSKLKIPEKGLFGLPSPTRAAAEDENGDIHKTVTTAERLDAEETNLLGNEETDRLGDEDIKLPSSLESSILNGQEIMDSEVPETIQQTPPEPVKSDNEALIEEENAKEQNPQAPKEADAIPLDVQNSKEPEAEQANSGSSKIKKIDKTLKQQKDETAKSSASENSKKKKAKSTSLVKKTYYIDHDLEGAIELMAVLQKVDQSDIVRQLLRSTIPEYYLNQWKMMSNRSK